MMSAEKAAIPPPSYTLEPSGLDAQVNAPSEYPPNFQSPMATGPVNGSMHAMHVGQSASPMMTPGAITPQQPAVATSPGDLEAQVGSQYQAQMFARCARGEHDVVKKYGPCGIITSVLLFPIGLIALFVDYERKCARCGIRLPK